MGTILCIIDGMTEGGFRVSDYPYLRAMQYIGDIQTIPDGYAAESLTGIFTLLGVQPIPQGIRGWVEAVGAGIRVNAEDLVLRGSWVSLDERGGAAGFALAPPEAPKLPAGMEYHPLGAYKSILIWRGMARAVKDIHTTAPHDSLGMPFEALLPAGNEFLRAVIRAAGQARRGSVALIPWAQSCAARLAPYPMRAAVVCGTDIMRGIGRVLGMDILSVKGATGDTDTDLAGKARAAINAAPEYELVVLHINGADEAGHRKDREEKANFIRSIDRLVIKELLNSGRPCVVTSDHGTDCRSGKHLGTSQPVLCAAHPLWPLHPVAK